MSVRVRLPNPLSALDDRALLARFAEERDQPAFEQLVKRHGGLVYGVCRRAVRDGHLAEDAFQAVFLVLARHPRRAAEAASVGGWLFGVARRVGLAARRHEERRQRHSRRAGGVSSLLERPHEPHPTSEFDDLLRVLDEELAAMPDEPRAALVACFLRERTQDEAARELGWSLSTLRRRLERGKELLRARLARRGVTLAAGLLTSAIAAPARAAVPALAESPSPTAAALATEAARAGVATKIFAAAAGLALACGGVAFGLAPAPADEPNPHGPLARVATPPAAPALAPAPRAVGAKRWVTLSGRVVFPKGRELPKTRLVEARNIKAADEWKPFMPLRYEDVLIDPDTRGIANAVVFLRPDSGDRKADFPKGKVHPDLAKQKPVDRTVFAHAGQFTPRVLVARAGDRVTFTNLLLVPTNVRYDTADGDEERQFNVLIPKDRSYNAKPLAATKLPELYTSSIYSWMKGYVWAFDHPYFAATDANGRFEIPKAPAGTWRLVVWQESVGWLGGAPGKLGRKVTIPATRTGTHELDPLTFDSDRWPE
jgi:RNA polymerase sigma factor (sigma-70 family)